LLPGLAVGYHYRMKTIQATFEAGVFRPLTPVALPEHCEVEFEPRVVREPKTAERSASIYAVLGERYCSGVADTAVLHNEHQP
jgi:predicted DNA-binding antitoxin AbrB/MazE fold protein